MPRTLAHRLALTILALAGTAAGQDQPTPPPQPEDPPPDDGPVVVGTPRETWKSVELAKLNAAIEFRWQYRNDTLNTPGQPSQRTTETRYRETLDLDGELIFGHKNLVDLTGSAQLGLEDVLTSGLFGQPDSHETDTVNLYDLSALVFGSSALPTTVFARRGQSLLDRPFASTIEENTSEYGIGTRYRSATAATSLQFSHRDQDLSGDQGALNSSTAQDSLVLNSVITLSQAQRLEVLYTLDRISERQAGGYADDYDRHDASLVHTYAFGQDAHPDELRSSLRFYDQSGRLSRENVRWDELLTLRHGDRLETRYNLVVDSQSVRGQEQRLTRADASIKHRLFDSLTSTATAGGQRLEAPGGATSDDYFASGALDYTKKVPLGRFDAALGAAYNAQRNSERGEPLRVINESYTFHDAFPIILPRRNITPGSVVLTPLAGFPVYQEGVDYTLDIFPGHAEIRGIVGGALVDGQTILASYDVGPEPGSDIDTATATFSVRYTIGEGFFDGLSVYSTYRATSHSVSAADPSLFTLDDVNDLLLGVEYRYAEFTGRYEFNDHASTLDPFTVHRVQGLYNLPLGPGSSLNADLTREVIDFTAQDNRVTFDRGTLRWTHRVSGALDVTARLEYRREDSTLNGLSEGFDQSLGFTFHKRQTTIYGSVRNSFLDGPATSQTTQYLQFGLRRTF